VSLVGETLGYSVDVSLEFKGASLENLLLCMKVIPAGYFLSLWTR